MNYYIISLVKVPHFIMIDIVYYTIWIVLFDERQMFFSTFGELYYSTTFSEVLAYVPVAAPNFQYYFILKVIFTKNLFYFGYSFLLPFNILRWRLKSVSFHL